MPPGRPRSPNTSPITFKTDANTALRLDSLTRQIGLSRTDLVNILVRHALNDSTLQRTFTQLSVRRGKP